PALLVLLVWTAGSQALVEQHIQAQVPTFQTDPASASLSIGMVGNTAKALKALGMTTAEAVPKSFAELQPLALAQGIMLPANGQDYMIGVALEANAQHVTNRLI